MPPALLHALIGVKRAAALVNCGAGKLETAHGNFFAEGAVSSWEVQDVAFDDVARSMVTAVPAFSRAGIPASASTAFGNARSSVLALQAASDPDFAASHMEQERRVVGQDIRDGWCVTTLARGLAETQGLDDDWITDVKQKLVYDRVVSLQSDLVLATARPAAPP